MYHLFSAKGYQAFSAKVYQQPALQRRAPEGLWSRLGVSGEVYGLGDGLTSLVIGV